MVNFETYCVKLPKIELHAHLNGSLSISTLQELQSLGPEHSQILKSIISHGSSAPLAECFELFHLAHSLTSNKAGLELATQRVIEEFAADGVVYLELRTTPRSVEGVMSKEVYITTVINAIKKAKENTPTITVKLIVSIDRRHSYIESELSIKLAIKLASIYPDVLCGVDLCGDPYKGQFHKELFQLARENGLKVTLHCAEIPAEVEVLSILQFKPDRIGHGTYIHPYIGGTDQLWQLLTASRIPVECCLTSNLKTENTKTYQDHHFKHLFEQRHPVILGTDDKGIFNTTLSREFFICGQTFDLNQAQLWKMSYNSIDFIFGSESEKNVLKDLLLEWKSKCL